MNMTWKDGLTTFLSVVVMAFSYLMVSGYKFPMITSYRWATAVLMLLGVGMCALSSYKPGTQSGWISFASVLGSIAIVLILATFITGSKMLFIALSGTIVVLWLGTTIRHFLKF